MTLTARRLGTVLVTSAAAALAAGTLAAPADAAPVRDLKPVIKRYRASVEACQVSVDDGAKIRIYVRLDNTLNRGRAGARSGGLYISRDGESTGKGVQLPVTPGGMRSRVKSVTFSSGGTITVDAGVGTGQMGDGATFAFKRIQPC